MQQQTIHLQQHEESHESQSTGLRERWVETMQPCLYFGYLAPIVIICLIYMQKSMETLLPHKKVTNTLFKRWCMAVACGSALMMPKLDVYAY